MKASTGIQRITSSGCQKATQFVKSLTISLKCVTSCHRKLLKNLSFRTFHFACA